MKRLILVCAAVGSFITAKAATDDSVFCRRIDAQVALTPGTPASYTVSGELCATEDELSTGGTVQLLIHGAAYNHTYWDFGTVNGIQYSYARDVAAHGFPTFALDLIGAGNSSHPPSNQVTNEVTAYVAHQIVQGLRSGSVNGSPLGLRVPFSKVIIVGHSLGSVTVWQEAINYGTAVPPRQHQTKQTAEGWADNADDRSPALAFRCKIDYPMGGAVERT